MNKTMYSFFILLWGIINTSPIFGQSNNCVAGLLACQQQIYEWTAPDYQNTIYFNYQMTISKWDNSVEYSAIRFYRQKKQIHLFTGKVDMIQDEKEAFLIFNDENIILKKDQPDYKIAKGALNGFKTLQKSFLENCDILKCQQRSGDEIYLSLKTTDTAIDLKFLDRINYRYHAKTNKILEVSSFFKKGYQAKQITQRFKTMTGQSNYVFKESARAYFFDSEGNMKPKFKSFQFIDHQQ